MNVLEKTLDHRSFEPLYHQLKEIIKQKIESEEWKPGDKISSENELVTIYKVSRSTTQRAVDELVQEGVLERRQGKGTFVSKPKIEQSLTSFYSFSRLIKSRGMIPKDVIIKIETVKAKREIAEKLQIKSSEEVITLQRLRLVNDEPIILETIYLPKEYVSGLSHEDLENYSLSDFLEKEYKLFIVKAKETFEAVLVCEIESEYLDVEQGASGLILERIAYDTKGRPIAFFRSLIRGDRSRFYTELL